MGKAKTSLVAQVFWPGKRVYAEPHRNVIELGRSSNAYSSTARRKWKWCDGSL